MGSSLPVNRNEINQTHGHCTHNNIRQTRARAQRSVSAAAHDTTRRGPPTVTVTRPRTSRNDNLQAWPVRRSQVATPAAAATWNAGAGAYALVQLVLGAVWDVAVAAHASA
jgi:hypothetical protein